MIRASLWFSRPDWVPRISALHAHQSRKLDLLCHTSLHRGTVSIGGRAITTGNCNCLKIENTGTLGRADLRPAGGPNERYCHVSFEKAQFTATRAKFSDDALTAIDECSPMRFTHCDLVATSVARGRGKTCGVRPLLRVIRIWVGRKVTPSLVPP